MTVNGELAIGADGGARDEALPSDAAGVADQVACGRIITGVQDKVVLGNEVQGICGGQRLRVHFHLLKLIWSV